MVNKNFKGNSAYLYYFNAYSTFILSNILIRIVYLLSFLINYKLSFYSSTSMFYHFLFENS